MEDLANEGISNRSVLGEIIMTDWPPKVNDLDGLWDRFQIRQNNYSEIEFQRNEEKILKMYFAQGKTYAIICKMLHISKREVSNAIKAFKKKVPNFTKRFTKSQKDKRRV